MKLVTIIGTRPQFIKAAAVSRAIAEHNNRQVSDASSFTEIIIHTGQHYDRNMSSIFFEEMETLKPNYYLRINDLAHGAMTGRMLEEIEKVLIEEKPDVVLVYGDTNSTLAGALGAAKLKIPVAHVEAGLRSFQKKMPEEINRVATDHVSDLLFCPTHTAVKNLKREGIIQGIYLVGDVMYDSVLYNMDLAEKHSRILEKLWLESKSYILATVHRAENTDEPKRLISIFQSLERIAKDGFPVIVPLHPRTCKKLDSLGLSFNNLQLIDPVSYLDMLLLEKHSQIILTDSGGVQKEAYWFNVPCVTLRDETEWVETVESGCNVLVGSKPSIDVKAVAEVNTELRHRDVYGNGRAAKQMVRCLSSF
jgi:UDP-GlcNAc3NAcA epimerase